MMRYIARRVLQMIPTVLGVILITFILFNVVGGSPASMTLGKHVSPAALEAFDEQRGFNKPLIFGNWTKTRALEDGDFVRNAGPWRAVQGAEHAPPVGADPGRVLLPGGADYPVPLAFGLRTNTTYRLKLRYRSTGAAELQWMHADGTEAGAPKTLAASPGWSRVTVSFRIGEVAAAPVLRVADGAFELRDIRLRRGMNNPLNSRFVFFLGQIARFDFGESSSLNQPVSKLLLRGMGPSLVLTVPIFVFGLTLSIAVALLCAFVRDTLLDRLLVVAAVALMSINYLVWIIAGQYLLSFKLGWFPVWGFASAAYLALPICVGTFSGLGSSVRFYRTIMLDEMYKDYVRTAFSKGVSRRGVLFRHVLKNAMIPIITNVVIAIPFLYTGSLLLESFFGIPGLGYLGVNAVNSSDVDVIRAIVFIGAVLYVVANLISDLCYAWVDPRVKLG